MADTVTWPLLRELASFRAEKGCATTLYLNLDPSEVPTAGDAQTRINALLNSAEKTDRRDLTHEQRGFLKADWERIAPCRPRDRTVSCRPCGRHRLPVYAAHGPGDTHFWVRLPLKRSVGQSNDQGQLTETPSASGSER